MSVKRAIVTGGTGMIGRSICRRLAADGMHVIVHTHKQPSRATEITEEIRRVGGSAEAVQFDVTDTGSTEQVLREVLRNGPVQVVVSNAGFYRDEPLAGMSADNWKSVIDVSLNGFYNVVHPLLMPMIRTRWGRIVAISSVSGILGNRGQVNYAAAKAGLHGAAKSLAIELASRGITANVVAPGFVDADGSERLHDLATIERMVPMKRPGHPDEVAGLVRYLASDESAYVTGQVISISGGLA